MNVPDNLKPVFAHWRVPQHINGVRAVDSGPPPSEILYRYRRGEGFVNDTEIELDELNKVYYSVPPAPNGGMTECALYDRETGEIVAGGYSVCSMQDPFNYKLGRQIALGRALSNL